MVLNPLTFKMGKIIIKIIVQCDANKYLIFNLFNRQYIINYRFIIICKSNFTNLFTI